MAWVIKVILGEDGGGGGGKLCRHPGPSLGHTRASGGGDYRIPRGVEAPTQGPPLREEAAAVAEPAEEEGDGN